MTFFLLLRRFPLFLFLGRCCICDGFDIFGGSNLGVLPLGRSKSMLVIQLASDKVFGLALKASSLSVASQKVESLKQFFLK